MTPNELADLMIQFDSGRVWEHAPEIADTLRKQQSDIHELLTIMYRAIKAGDWKVDGACDPSELLDDFKPSEDELI